MWPLPIFPSLWKRLSSFSLAAYLHLYHCVFPLSSPSLPLSRRSSAISPLRFLYIPSPMSLSLCLLRHACLSSFCRPPSQLTLDIQSFSSPRVPLPSPPWPRVTQEARGTPLKKSQGRTSTCASPPGLQIGTWCWDPAVLLLGVLARMQPGSRVGSSLSQPLRRLVCCPPKASHTRDIAQHNRGCHPRHLTLETQPSTKGVGVCASHSHWTLQLNLHLLQPPISVKMLARVRGQVGEAWSGQMSRASPLPDSLTGPAISVPWLWVGSQLRLMTHPGCSSWLASALGHRKGSVWRTSALPRPW